MATKAERKENFLAQFRGENKIDSVDFMKIWKFYDKDRSGSLDIKQLTEFLADLLKAKGVKATKDLVAEHRTRILDTFDINKDNTISLQELALIVPLEKNYLTRFVKSKQLTNEQFDDLFKHYDKDKTGLINQEELSALLMDMFAREGQHLDANDLDQYVEMIREMYDVGKDGKLGKEDIRLLISTYGQKA